MAPDLEPHDQPHGEPQDQTDERSPDAPTVPNIPVAPTTPVPPVTGWPPSAGQSPAPGADGPAPGWYPDPWLAGHYRYWSGTQWTGDSYRGPDPFAPSNPPPYSPYLSSGESTWTSAGSTWDAPPAPPVPPAGPAGPLGPPAPPELPGDRPKMSRGRFAAILGLVAVVVGSGSFAGAYLYHSRSETTSAALSPSPLAPSSPSTPSTTPPPADPSSSSLSKMVVTQDDVDSSLKVQTIDQGQSLGQPTLDLCNGNYPSESLRTGRLQVAVYDNQGNAPLSTEAVLYRNDSATKQAFNELTSVAANCPSGTSKFNAAPDGSWPAITGVQRLAYDFTTTDSTGQATHTVAVYLTRGRALLGIYFPQPDSPPTVAGQSTISGIVNLLATRLAQLPTASIGA